MVRVAARVATRVLLDSHEGGAVPFHAKTRGNHKEVSEYKSLEKGAGGLDCHPVFYKIAAGSWKDDSPAPLA